MMVDNEKLGFYGTSTGTRLLFKGDYADFVMQFDYISLPYGVRGRPHTNESYAALQILYGGKEDTGLSSYYTFGIRDGNVWTNYGAESLVTIGDGKSGGTSSTTAAVLSQWTAWSPAATADAEGEATEQQPPEGAVFVTKNSAANDGYYTFNSQDAKDKTLYNQTTRFKMVVLNNTVKLYCARITDGVVGDYRLLITREVPDASGKVGFGTDSPAWCEIDNLCLTPITKEQVLGTETTDALTIDAVMDDEYYEVDPADMDDDPMPSPLPKPVPVVDLANAKITWAAVAGAECYEVTLSYEGSQKEKVTVYGTEFSIADYMEDDGDYEVGVQAMPANVNSHMPSRGTVRFTIEPNGGGSGNTPKPQEPTQKAKGCGCGSSAAATAGGAAAVLLLGGAAVLSLRKKKEA